MWVPSNTFIIFCFYCMWFLVYLARYSVCNPWHLHWQAQQCSEYISEHYNLKSWFMLFLASIDHFNATVKTANSFSRPPLRMASPHRFTQTAALTPCVYVCCPLHILYLLHFVACRQLVRHPHRGFAGEGRRSVARARVFTEFSIRLEPHS